MSMEVNTSASAATVNNYSKTESHSSDASQTSSTATAAPTETPAAIFEPSGAQNNSINSKKIQQMMDESNRQAEMFRKLIEGMYDKQGRAYKIATADLRAFAGSEEAHDQMTKELIEKIRSGELEIDETTRNKAIQDISEDGYWGVKQTSVRILDMAKSLAGGDASHIPALREAFQKGYDSAAALFGDELPSLVKDTYDAVMKGFDEWANSANS